MVLLIGNYSADRQHSMLRFGTMMLQGLTDAGIPAELVQPEPGFGKAKFVQRLLGKWLGYVDKLVVFPRELREKLANPYAVVHICDHSNAVYAHQIRNIPLVVTCHDLLAVRGALGEETDCPASLPGTFLQWWITKGLARASAVACVSHATERDAERLIKRENGHPEIRVIPNGLNYPYQKLTAKVAHERLARVHGVPSDRPFVLHVGSNLVRKNRAAVLRIFSLFKAEWDGHLVMAGEALTPELHLLGRELGVSERVVEIVNPDSQILETLYNSALALIYPSRFEGFGWPVIEAQACGCPVVCSHREPLPEVGGNAVLMNEIDDEQGFANDLRRLLAPDERRQWSRKGLKNAERFSTARMIARYVELYRELGAKV